MLRSRLTHIPILGMMIILLIGAVACSQVALPTDNPSEDAVAVVEATDVPPTAVPPTAVPPTTESVVAALPTEVPPTVAPPTIAPPTVAPPTVAPVAAAPANGDWSTFTEMVDLNRHAIGNPFAEVTIVEFSDFM